MNFNSGGGSGSRDWRSRGGAIFFFRAIKPGCNVITEVDVPCSCRGSMKSKFLELYMASKVGRMAPPSQCQMSDPPQHDVGQ